MKSKSSDYVLFGVDFSSNEGQKELIRNIRIDHTIKPVVFCVGSAGTGKTFAALAGALGEVRGYGGNHKKYKNIYYVREPVEIGHRLGYLKGTEEDKYAPYLGPLLDNYLHLMAFASKKGEDKSNLYLKRKESDGELPFMYSRLPSDIIPLAPEFLRGRSFDDCIIIVDEAQNLTLDELQTLVTRIGSFCKMIIIGSPNQIDIPGQSEENNDFMTAYKILEPTGLVSLIKLEAPMRSSFVVDFDLRFTEYKEKKRKK
ncbi:MAG: PhoH family protein [Bacilli bacterium]|nr:PhoH family protein [Bacilli bacterium]